MYMHDAVGAFKLKLPAKQREVRRRLSRVSRRPSDRTNILTRTHKYRGLT